MKQDRYLEGHVISIKEFGAFIEFAPGKEGMVHISKISKERVNHVEDVLTLGDKVKVVCLGKDKMGRFCIQHERCCRINCCVIRCKIKDSMINKDRAGLSGTVLCGFQE